MTKQTNNSLPMAKIKQIKRISPFWLLPVIAFIIGAVLFFQIIQEQGKMITITFDNGEGLVAGKTQVRYQGLQIGVVKKVNFTDDLKKVEVQANIYPEAKSILRENTKFWLVKPSASLAGISGIDALVSGNYITIQPGDGDDEDEFIAESEGPIAQVNPGDLLIHLIADDLGSISAGASIYFKKMPVGKVYDYRFIEDGKKVSIDVVIDKPYSHLVKKESRFWNISGIHAELGLTGVNLAVDSLNSVVQGAVAFDSPMDSEAAQSNDNFTLYSNLEAAKRGMSIDVRLPKLTSLQADKIEVYYQDNPIGVLADVSAVENQEDLLQGKLLIDPNLAHLFKSQTQIVLRHKKLNLTELADAKKWLRGQYFDVIAGDGEPQHQFEVIKESEFLLKQPDSLILTLTATETYGIAEGQPLYYQNTVIGDVVKQQVELDKVYFQVAIASQYRHLIYADTNFIAASNFDLTLDASGLHFQTASPEKWLQGGIRVVQGEKKQGQPLEQYPLYSDVKSAEFGIENNQLTPTIVLHSQQLPSIDKNSLVLYRQYEVGKILAIHPRQTQFDIDVFIYPKYRHLLTEKSIFWVESAAQVDITPKGISIQASPISRALKGAISFDNTSSGQPKTLYPNELRAKSAGQQLEFIVNDATNLSKGTSLRYLGLTVGEIDSLNFDQKKRKIIAKALINPQYMPLIAKEGSRFKLISPQISAGGIENLDSLLQPYIDIEIGEGKRKTQFNLQQSVSSNNQYNNGFPLILETSDALNLTTGSPVLYRGIEVGTIRQLSLNDLGDRVLVSIMIAPKYQHLVRQNSQFWIASGYDFNLSFKGAEFNTGSVQQLLKGGISFSTPTGKIVEPPAKANQRFMLQIKRPENAQHWNSVALP